MTKKNLLNLSDSALNSVVSIEGTNYDRKRKLTNLDISNIKKSVSSGKKVSEVAKKFDVAPSTIEYHLSPATKAAMNAKRNTYARNYVPSADYQHELAEYKRQLINEGKKVIVK